MNDLALMLQAIASVYPRPDYDTWLKIASGVWSTYLFDESFHVLNSIWPEEKSGEYSRKYQKRLKTVTMGTVFFLARQCGYTGHGSTNAYRPAPKTHLPTLCRDEMEKRFNVVELVTGSPRNRPGKLVYVESITDLDGYGEPGQVDVYHSIYWHSTDVQAYIQGNNGKLEGYAGPVKAMVLHFDCDNKDHPENALNDARLLIERICTDYGVSIEDVDIWFSGCKGFSVFVHDQAVMGCPGAVDVPERIKSICCRMASGIKSFDSSPYDRTRIWRVPNTINSKSGLYKIPLLPGELYLWNIDQIRERAKHQRSLQDATEEFITENVHHGK
jgi:hypothetical protein